MAKVLVFAPHSAVWVHTFPEALVAEALLQQGHEVLYITCGQALKDQCIVMHGAELSVRSPEAQRAAVCARCTSLAALVRREFGFRGWDLSQSVQESDQLEAQRITRETTRETCLQLEIDGIPAGRLALYELLLKYKKGNLDFTDEQWQEYRALLKNTLLVLFAMRRIMMAERPDRLLVYNGLYSVNRTACMVAQGLGIPQFFLHAGGNLAHRLQTLMLGRDHTYAYFKRLIEGWPRFRGRPCSRALLRRITDHLLVLISGRSYFVYSARAAGAGVNLRARFGVAEGQRLLVATMSSYDERFSGETVGALAPEASTLFERQVDWIQALVEWVRERPDLFLVVRVHPREFPSRRRGGVRSEHSILLAQALADLPGNARVNWPDDHVSLYDLANVTDVFLNAWSTAGKEMSALGIPVVVYSPGLLFYPADLNFVGTTREDFFTAISRALEAGWSFERARATFRWLAVEYGYGLLDISDSYPDQEGARGPVLSRAVNRLRRRIDPYYAEARDCRRRARALRAAHQVDQIVARELTTPLDTDADNPEASTSFEEETLALREQLGRLAQALCPSREARRYSRLYDQLSTTSRQG